MTFTKILCPTDFSDGSRHALELATRLARRHHAELVILHAWDLPVYMDGYAIAPSVIDQMNADATKLLADAMHSATEAGVTHVSGRDVGGAAWRVIVDQVGDDPAIDLVVMGTHGRTGLRRVLLGSVAEKVVRLASASVLAVHPDDRVGELATILCPTDFSEEAMYALRLATQVVDPSLPGARIDLVNVVEVPVAGTHIAAMVAARETEAASHLERLAAQVTSPCRIVVRTEAGHVGEQLVTLVENEVHDLVVVGHGVKRAPLGSTAEKLVRHAKCPVLVARKR